MLCKRAGACSWSAMRTVTGSGSGSGSKSGSWWSSFSKSVTGSQLCSESVSGQKPRSRHTSESCSETSFRVRSKSQAKYYSLF
jgi:hypothetical protein